ncbi:MAG: 30S ribosomal protein S16 [Proteobacteria bacterium]|nr:30S ribosomal protein S16 [Pseudomonadota bacterium]
MATRIRLARHGAKKRPFYRIVVTESESPRDGRFIEIVGTYNPLDNPATVVLKEERIKHWMDQGATCSDTVTSLLKKQAKSAPPAA